MYRDPSFSLSSIDLTSLERFLQSKGWLSDGETPSSVAVATGAKQNFVLKVPTNRRGLILKQSHAFFETSPQLAAPPDRILHEARFYECVEKDPVLKAKSPEILGVDEDAYIEGLIDLGEGQNASGMYEGRELSEAELNELLSYLSALHRLKIGKSQTADFENKSVRRLLHEDIFSVPLRRDNGIALDARTPGLKVLAESLKLDDPLVLKVNELGETYRATGSSLVHGDFCPENIWLGASGVKVLDPEFCFLGPAEFDVGTMIAHLMLSESTHSFSDILENYRGPKEFSPMLALQFAGVEIIRRVIGSSSIVLRWSLIEKSDLLETAREWVLEH